MPRFVLTLIPLAALAALVPLTPAPARAPDPTADAALVKTAQGMFKDLTSTTLDNGLRVYLLPVKGAPVVTTMVAYRVGSADEEKDQTGLSHYLEHLMFKGTGKLMPGDIDRLTQRNGGRNNAYTSEDITNYHFDFAADRWEAALDIEADRMRNVLIDAKHEFQQEKGAVISELAGGEDSPWDLEYKTILPLLWPKDSPYSHPVIGQREHVRGATAEVIKRHYDKWYHPNNASRHRRRRVRPGRGADEDQGAVRLDPEGRAAAAQGGDVPPGAQGAGAPGVRVEVRRAAAHDRVQHGGRRHPRRPDSRRDPERPGDRQDGAAVPHAGGGRADRVGGGRGQLRRPLPRLVRG